MRFGLKEEVVEEIVRVIGQEEKIEKAVIFGSRARGDWRKGSDIDIGIYAKGMDSKDFNLLRDELEQLDIIYKIDVVDVYGLSKERLVDNIEEEGKAIYKS
ncbi:nucleotidyltransferase domain-containing protein [Halonatronum saccharophilum]|uniref:nucleotidyltransferase domain-containing protein n=1 Tax=Halonatronum saccharophilum TaxID=150060 RepID=UPI00048907C8|nr:nucleotidyltransferase domain-containing protein [Halonatronum saccharophilum]